MRFLSIYLVIAGMFCAISSCTEDRVPDLGKKPFDTTDHGIKIIPGMILVNEFVAYQYGEANEFGDTVTWAEFYNTTNDTILLEAGHWYVTDKGWDEPDRYELPEISIAPKGFLLIWCDNEDMHMPVSQDIHTNFSLNRNGEAIGIYYKDDDGNMVEIDNYEFGPQEAGTSKGRYPDGANNWVVFETRTPGAPNIY
jgi:hypothetical protein